MGVVGSQYGPKATAPCADDQSAGGVGDGTDGAEGSTSGVGGHNDAAGSPGDRCPNREHAVGHAQMSESQEGWVKDQARRMPEELRDGKGVCVMCKKRGADRLCKYCGWPLHRATCALPVREPLLTDYAHLMEEEQFYPMEGEKEEAACVDCLCRVQPPCCVSWYAAC